MSCAATAGVAGKGEDRIPFLYISAIFPPRGGAEPRCNLTFVRTMVQQGFVPTVVTVAESGKASQDSFLERLIPPELKIIRLPGYPWRNARVSQVRSILRVPQNGLVFDGWRKFYDAAQAGQMRKEYRFIYSVHGIGAAHLAAMRLKARTGLPWIAEFQDPWAHNVILNHYLKGVSWSWWYRHELAKTRKFLGQVLAGADLVVVESPVHEELLRRDFPGCEGKVMTSMLGYDDDLIEGSETCLEFVQRPVLGFVGMLYYGYDYVAQNLILALKQLQAQGRKFTLVSVGKSSPVFSRFAEEASLANVVPIGTVSLRMALGIMKSLDFGLVTTADDYPMHVNSKLWEYLRCNLSILGLVPAEGAMGRIITAGQCGYVLPYDVEGMVRVLAEALDDFARGAPRRADAAFVQKFARQRLMEPLVERIRTIL